MVDGVVATQFAEGEDQYDVRVRLAKEDRTSLENIRNLAVKSNKDAENMQMYIVPVGSVAEIVPGAGPSAINRFDRQREIRIGANLAGRTLG